MTSFDSIIESGDDVRGPRRLIALGAAVTAAGLALAGTAPVVAEAGWRGGQQPAGGVVVLAGWALLAWGIHRLGREA
ncbi:MAG: hypothetical protein ACREJ3_02920 [Polyangiaceae bacterium]